MTMQDKNKAYIIKIELNVKITGNISMVTSLTTDSLWVNVFNATSSNISVTSWRSVFLGEETGVPRENHLSAACH
jgi:hypothetical protein